jgi:hypothetical protein
VHPEAQASKPAEEFQHEELPLFRPEVAAAQDRSFGEVMRSPQLRGYLILWSLVGAALAGTAAMYATHVDAVHLIHWLFQRS